MKEFAVRSAYGKPELPLIEFRGNHRSPEFPKVFCMLAATLSGFDAEGSWPAPDDFLWTCRYERGQFELSDDRFSLFIIPKENEQQVVKEVAAALESSGCFKAVTSWNA